MNKVKREDRFPDLTRQWRRKLKTAKQTGERQAWMQGWLKMMATAEGVLGFGLLGPNAFAEEHEEIDARDLGETYERYLRLAMNAMVHAQSLIDGVRCVGIQAFAETMMQEADDCEALEGVLEEDTFVEGKLGEAVEALVVVHEFDFGGHKPMVVCALVAYHDASGNSVKQEFLMGLPFKGRLGEDPQWPESALVERLQTTNGALAKGLSVAPERLASIPFCGHCRSVAQIHWGDEFMGPPAGAHVH